MYFEHIICVLRTMFVHFDHNVGAFRVQSSSILNMALFFLYLRHSLSFISVMQFCPLWSSISSMDVYLFSLLLGFCCH